MKNSYTPTEKQFLIQARKEFVIALLSRPWQDTIPTEKQMNDIRSCAKKASENLLKDMKNDELFTEPDGIPI